MSSISPHTTRRNRRLLLRAVPLVLIGAAAFALGMVAASGSADEDAVERFTAAWEADDVEAMYAEISAPSRRRTSLENFERAYRRAGRVATIDATSVGEVRGTVDGDGEDAYAVATTIETRSFGTIEADLEVPTSEGAVSWEPQLVFPGLRRDEQLDRETRAPKRAAIVARDGTKLVTGPIDARVVDPIGSVVAGEIGDAPKARAEQMARQGFPEGTAAGTSGLELAFDGVLAGTPGGRLIARSDSGSEPRVLAESPPRKGKRLRTTIDPELQQAASAALGEQFGGVAALDTSSGEVLALAGIAFSAPQPPGSTFKIITTTAALEDGVTEPSEQFPVTTSADVGGREIANAHDEPCGGDLVESFALSCNSVFGPLGAELGPERLLEEAEEFGFNSPPTLYEDAAIAATQPPGSTIPDPIGSDLDAGVSGIGQGQVLATPLQMASVAQTIANDGTRSPTSLVKDPELASEAGEVEVTTPEVAEQLSEMMGQVVESGTGQAAALEETKVAGKTGTAELGAKAASSTDPANPSADPEQEVDAWFTAYAPLKRPEIAIAVMIVNADGDGGVVAAPIAREVLASKLG